METALNSFDKEQKAKVQEVLKGLTPEQISDVVGSYDETLNQLKGEKITPDKVKEVTEKANKINNKKPSSQPKTLGSDFALLSFFNMILDDPTVYTESPIPDGDAPATKKTREQSLKRGEKAVEKYKLLPEDVRQRHLKALKKEAKSLHKGSARRDALDKLQQAIVIANVVSEGKEVKGVSASTARLFMVADKSGQTKKLLNFKPKGSGVSLEAEEQALARNIVSSLSTEHLHELLDEGHPALEILKAMESPYLSFEDRKGLRQEISDIMIEEMVLLDPEVDEGLGEDASVHDRERAARRGRPDVPPPDLDTDGGGTDEEEAKGILAKVKAYVPKYVAALVETAQGLGERLKGLRDAPAKLKQRIDQEMEAGDEMLKEVEKGFAEASKAISEGLDYLLLGKKGVERKELKKILSDYNEHPNALAAASDNFNTAAGALAGFANFGEDFELSAKQKADRDKAVTKARKALEEAKAASEAAREKAARISEILGSKMTEEARQVQASAQGMQNYVKKMEKLLGDLTTEGGNSNRRANLSWDFTPWGENISFWE